MPAERGPFSVPVGQVYPADPCPCPRQTEAPVDCSQGSLWGPSPETLNTFSLMDRSGVGRCFKLLAVGSVAPSLLPFNKLAISRFKRALKEHLEQHTLESS